MAATIKPNSNLYELQEVKVLGSADVDYLKVKTAQAQLHHVQTDTAERKEDFTEINEGINLEDMCVNEQKRAAVTVSHKMKGHIV